MTSSSSSASSSSSRRFFGEEWTVLSTRMLGGGRDGCAYASLDDKSLFLFGGWDANARSSTVVEYNSTTQNWRTHPPLPEARSSSAATAIDEDRLLVVGGLSSSTRNSCVVYNTRSKKWSTNWPLLNIGRHRHASIFTHNKKAYVIGGYNSNGNPLDSIEEIDLSLPTPRWTVLPQGLQKKRFGCCAIAHPKNPNTILVVGGWNKDDKYLRCCEMVCLDQAQEEQTRRVPSLMTPRACHTLVLVENRFVVAMGGADGSQRVSSVEYLDLEEEPQEQQQWRPLPSMTTARSRFAAFYCPENHKIVVAGGIDNTPKRLDTAEELPVLFRGHACSSRQPPEPPRPRIPQWLDEMERFLESSNKREGDLIQERDENRRLCVEYIAQVSERQRQARRQANAISSWVQDTRSTRGNPTDLPTHAAVPANVALHQDIRQPPALTKIPPGHMDADHLQDIEQWIREMDEKKNAYVAAVDTREIEINKQVNENRRVREEYLAKIKAVTASNENPNTTGTPQPGAAFVFQGQGSFDVGAQSIPSRLDRTSVSTRGPFLRQGSVVGAVGLVTLREDDDVSAITSVTMPQVKDKKKKKRRWLPWRR